MSQINITNIEILDNPAPYTSPLSFKITFECLKDLPEDVEWKIIYIGSSKDEKYDQMLDSFSMGPLQFGVMEFDLASNPPDHTKIPKDEVLGVTALIISVLYREKEFFRVGYYVYNTYTDPELNENPPEEIQINKVNRNILSEKPRITRYNIAWDDNEEVVEGTEEGQGYSNEETGTHLISSDVCFQNHSNPFMNPNDEVSSDHIFSRNVFGGEHFHQNQEQKSLF